MAEPLERFDGERRLELAYPAQLRITDEDRLGVVKSLGVQLNGWLVENVWCCVETDVDGSKNFWAFARQVNSLKRGRKRLVHTLVAGEPVDLDMNEDEPLWSRFKVQSRNRWGSDLFCGGERFLFHCPGPCGCKDPMKKYVSVGSMLSFQAACKADNER